MMSYFALGRKKPEEEGVNSSNIISFIESLEKNRIECHGFTIIRHGNVIAEAFWKPYRKDLPHMLFSLSKSFTAMAVGFAVCEGRINVSDPVAPIFKGDLPENMDPKFNNLEIRHLLCMATGHSEDFLNKVIASGDRNWIRQFFAEPLRHEPGTHFLYNNMATYMLSAIVTKVTGQSVLEYLTPRLFSKLGIEKPYWGTDFNGISLGAWGLNLKNEDIARFGLMLLNKGAFYGERVVPEEWAEEATTCKISNGNNPDSDWNQGYGYQFWMCRHNAFRGDGAFGQYCLVLPEKDAVIAINSGIPDMQVVLNLVYDHLLPGMGDKPMESSNEYQKLVAKCENLHYSPEVVGSCLVKSPYAGRNYTLEKNRFGLTQLLVSLNKDILTLTVKGSRGFELKAGMNVWLEGTAKLKDDPVPKREIFRTAASYSWEDDKSLSVDVRYIETPFRYRIKCLFEGNNAELSIIPNVSMDPDADIHLRGKAV